MSGSRTISTDVSTPEKTRLPRKILLGFGDEHRDEDPIVVFDAVIHLWLECRSRSLWVYPQVGGTLILVKTTV